MPMILTYIFAVTTNNWTTEITLLKVEETWDQTELKRWLNLNNSHNKWEC